MRWMLSFAGRGWGRGGVGSLHAHIPQQGQAVISLEMFQNETAAGDVI